MEDVIQEKTAVNSQEQVSGSAPVIENVEAATTPTTEQVEASSTQENKIPQSRFNEVIEQRNADRARAEALESRLRALESQKPGASPKETLVEAEVKRLVTKLQMSEEAAREIVQTNINIQQAHRNEQEARQRQVEASQWAGQKAAKDPDYKVLEPELDRQFSSLPSHMQAFIANNPSALEMFYDSVKSRHSTSKAKEAFGKGADEAYKTKQLKQAVSSTSGGSATPSKSGIENWRSWPLDEYKKRLPEINAALAKGQLK